MKRGILHARIPTLLALIMLLSGVFTSVFLIQRQISTLSKASQESVPKNVRITNVTDFSFTATFVTDIPNTAALSVNFESSQNKVIIDDRDKERGEQKKRTSHSITVTNLTENTEVTFSIITGSKEYDNNGEPFRVKTGTTITSSPPSQIPLFGKILLPDNALVTDALIYASTQNSQTISATTNGAGEYILPLNSLRNQNLDNYELLQENSVIHLAAISGNISSEVDILYKNAESIPAILLSQNYQFTSDFSPKQIPNQALQTITDFDVTLNFDVFSPSQGEEFIDSQPEFEGTALQNNSVQIQISGNVAISESVSTNSEGVWRFRPTSPLSPGEYTLKVSGIGKIGGNQNITRSFVIYSEGSQIAQFSDLSVSPSQPTPTPTSSPAPTSNPTPTASPIPTLPVEPTETPSPTLTPTTSVPTPTTEVVGTSMPTFPPTESPPSKMPQMGFSAGGALTILSGLVIVTGISLLFLF